MGASICVFCASSPAVARPHVEAAERLGAALAERGHTLVYGGGSIGLMGTLARAVHAGGGRVVGVIPEALRDRELAYLEADELIVTADMRDRKTIMEKHADAFLTLPGGFGTLEELFEILALRILRYHDKPTVIASPDGFYDPLLAMLDKLFAEGFAKERYRTLYDVAPDAIAGLDLLEQRLTAGREPS